MRIKERMSFFLGWPLSLIALYYLFTLLSSRWGSIASEIIHVNIILLFLSTLCFVGYFAGRIIVWNKLIGLTGGESVHKKAAFSWMMSELKRFVPGSIWGSVSRVKSFGSYTGSKKSVVKHIGVELYLVAAGSSLVALLGLPRVFQTQPLWYSVPLTLLIVGILVIIFVIKHIPLLKRFFQSVTLRELLHLSLLSAIAFFFFGLGSYLGFKSILPVSINDWIYLTGYFNIALLVGFLTVITPLGLGVREAAIVLLLTPIFGSSNAIIAAIFVRFCSILGEVLTILLLGLWQKVHIQKQIQWLSLHKYSVVLALMTLIYMAYFGFVSIQKHNVFLTGRYDLGNMDQVVWNTSQGRLFQFTNPDGDGTQIMSRLGVHADIILVFLTPFYYIWNDPRMLLIIQTVALASGGIFVYLIAQKILNKKSLALLFAFLYFCNPLVQYVNLYDFHAVSLAVPLLLGGFYFILQDKIIWSVLFLVLAGFTKENVWISNILLGIVIIIRKKHILGSLVAFGSLALFLYYIFIGIPGARGTNSHFAIAYYSDFGGSTKDVFAGMISHPGEVISRVFHADRLVYLFQIFAPLGFISLIAFPYLIPAGGDFGINLLSSNPNYYQIWYQYTTVIIPFLFIATMYGVKYLILIWPQTSRILPWYLCITTLIMAFTLGPLPGSSHNNTSMYEGQISYARDIEKALDKIPQKSSVAATNNLGAHLMRHKHIYTIPTGITSARYVAFLLTDWSAQPSLPAQRKLADSLRHNPNYVTIFSEKDFVLFRKIK